MTQKLSYLLVIVIFALGISSCGSTKKIEKTEGAIEVIVPLSGKDYRSNKEFFRAKSSGKSPNMSAAKKIALQNAKTEVAGLIKTTIKAVTDNYVNQRSVGDADDFESKFEEMSRSVINQKLVGIVIIGEKILKHKDGRYEYWIAIEVSKDAIINGMNSKISQDKKLQIDYDKHKFTETFNKEMENFGN